MPGLNYPATRLRELLASSLVSVKAIVALVARDVVVGEDPITLPNVHDAFTHGGYDSDCLMPEDWESSSVFTPSLLDVRAAEAARFHLDQELANADVGNGNLRNFGANHT